MVTTSSASSAKPMPRCRSDPERAAKRKLAEVSAASGKDSAQKDSAKGSLSSAGTWIATSAAKKYPAFSRMRAGASTTPPFNCSHARKATAGGATRITIVGRSLPGSGSWKISRLKTSVSRTSQKTRPTEKKYQASSTWPRGTPASGAITLPTAGMNQAGDICAGPKARCEIQAEITTSVSTPCPAAAAIQMASAAPGSVLCRKAAKSSSEIVMAGKKASRTGWCHSAPTAAGWRIPLSA